MLFTAIMSLADLTEEELIKIEKSLVIVREGADKLCGRGSTSQYLEYFVGGLAFGVMLGTILTFLTAENKKVMSR